MNKESNAEAHRVTSSLQSAIENNSFESPKPHKKTSLPESSQKGFLEELHNKSTFLNNRNLSKVPNSHSPVIRHRSSTESTSSNNSPEVPRKPNTSYLAKKTGSTEWGSSDQGSNHSSPQTSISDKPLPQVPPKPKRPAPVAPPKKPAPSSERTSSAMSSSSERSSRGDLNPLELYATVEKEMDAEAQTKLNSDEDTRPRPNSAASLTSTDSGIRTSLEIPGRGPNADIPSDFDHSDGDDSLIGHSSHSPEDDSSPKVR